MSKMRGRWPAASGCRISRVAPDMLLGIFPPQREDRQCVEKTAVVGGTAPVLGEHALDGRRPHIAEACGSAIVPDGPREVTETPAKPVSHRDLEALLGPLENIWRKP